MSARLAAFLLPLVVAPAMSFADVVRLTNGDTLHGTVISLDLKSLVLESANFGELTIAREKVGLIALGEAGLPSPAAVEAAPVPARSAVEALVPSLQSPQIQGQLKQLFGEALGGKSVRELQNDIRSARRQLKSLQDDLGDGPEADALGAYLRLFDQFAPPADASEQQQRFAPEGKSSAK